MSEMRRTPYLDMTRKQRAAFIAKQAAGQRPKHAKPRDPLAAPFDEWPFRGHRSLAEIAERPADSGAA